MAWKAKPCYVVYVPLMVMSFSSWINGEAEVPCYFIFGASYYDNGNNNALLTMIKANYPPYGIDFPQGATGRFSNGRNIADFIAELLGFNHYIPSFESAIDQDMLRGVNYASGGSGIRHETGKTLGARISMDGQLFNHQITVSRITQMLGDKDLAANQLSKCIYSVGMGDNDYINNYFMPKLYTTSLQYTPEQYATVLIEQYSQQLRTLYNLGARKVALFGIGALGCAPGVIAAAGTNRSSSSSSSCVEEVNQAIQIFNTRLGPLVDELNSNLPDAKFIFVNTYQMYFTSSSGFRVTNAACCKVVTLLGTCIPFSQPCPERGDYIWWDGIHQTEAANMIVARRSYNSQTPLDTYPFDISHLAHI